MNSKIHRISKGEKKKINCTENYSTNTNFNIKTRFARDEKKNAIKSEMSWGNVIPWRYLHGYSKDTLGFFSN